MNRILATVVFVASIASLAVAQDQSVGYALEPDDVHDFLIFKDHAYIVGKPILVAAPTAANPSWSPSGQFLVYAEAQDETNILSVQDSVQSQKTAMPERKLCVYSIASGKSSDIISLGSNASARADVNWIAGSDRALVDVDAVAMDADTGVPTDKHTLYLLDATTSSLKEFSPWEGTDKPWQFEINPSPTQPYAFVRGSFMHKGFTPEGKPKFDLSSQLVLVASTGNFGQVRVPDDTPSMITTWSPDGSRAYVMTRVKQDNGKSKANWYGVSLVNGDIKPIDRPTDFYMGAEKGGLIAIREVGQPTIDGKASAGLNSIWLETTDPDSQNRLLLAGDARDAAVNKTMDCASYISQGSLFVRPIAEVAKRRYDEAVAAYNRSLLLHQAQQAGAAIFMYMADYGDIFPTQSQNLSQILGPYMQDSSLLNGFTYTYPGGPAINIASPSTTQIGYVDGSDGRAVVYADGHAKWVPK